MILFYLAIIIAIFSLIIKTIPNIDPNEQEDARSRYYSSGYGSRSKRTY